MSFIKSVSSLNSVGAAKTVSFLSCIFVFFSDLVLFVFMLSLQTTVSVKSAILIKFTYLLTFTSNSRPSIVGIQQPNTVTQTLPLETSRPRGLAFPHVLRQIIVQTPDNLC